MDKAGYEFLKQLIDVPSPSGYEEEASRLWREWVGKFVDKVYSDVHGNSFGVLKPDSEYRVMLAGHIDEIGYMINYIDDNGFLYFRPIGGFDRHIVPGHRVWIRTRKGKLLGVIGKKPTHLLEKEEREKVLKFENMWIDIGAKDKKEAESLVRVGDIAVPAYGLEELNDKVMVARGFDDKIGAFVVAETLRLLADQKANLKVAVYGVATVQEEIGLRGAHTSAYRVNPNVGIAIDVGFASDTPDIDKKITGEVKLGGGPIISRGANINPKIFDMLVATAEENNIPYQLVGAPRGTGTDANIIQLTRAGVATGLISIPNRYMHTPVELIHKDDVDNAARLLAKFILKLDESTDFTIT